MGFRFYKRTWLSRWFGINFNKKSVSVTVGPPGLRLTTGTKGARVTVGVPKTGLYVSKQVVSTAKPRRRKKQKEEIGWFENWYLCWQQHGWFVRTLMLIGTPIAIVCWIGFYVALAALFIPAACLAFFLGIILAGLR